MREAKRPTNDTVNRAGRIQLASFMLGTSLVLMPFNDLPYLKEVFRELSSEASFYALGLGVVYWGLTIMAGGRVWRPAINASTGFLLLFLFWILVSGLANVDSIGQSIFKGRAGPTKYLSQVGVIYFFVTVALFTFNVCYVLQKQFPLFWFRSILWSVVVVSVFAIPEILLILGIDLGRPLLTSTYPYIHTPRIYDELWLLRPLRLRGVSGEASWFAMYSIFVFPFVWAATKTKATKQLAYVCLTMLVVELYFTFSRLAYVVVGLEAFLSLFLDTRIKSLPKAVTLFAILLAIPILANQELASNYVQVVKSLSDQNDESNLGRVGSQYSAFAMGMENSVFGVGLGQYGFFASEFMPAWALSSWEVREWMSPSTGSAWPPAHGLFARIVAELGFIGLVFWLLYWVATILACFKRARSNSGDVLGMAIVVAMVGSLFIGFGADSFRFLGYWALSGVAWAYQSVNTHSSVC